MSNVYKIEFDGSCLSKNKAKLGGTGTAIYKNGKIICTKSKAFKKTTSNEMEFVALIIGLHYLLKHVKSHKINKNDTLEIYGDSELVITQVSGIRKVDKMIKFHRLAIKILNKLPFKKPKLEHVYRDKNKVADALASKYKFT